MYWLLLQAFTDLWLSEEQVNEILKFPPEYLCEWLNNGDVPFELVDGRRMIRLPDLAVLHAKHSNDLRTAVREILRAGEAIELEGIKQD